MNEDTLKLLAIKEFNESEDLYLIVDFLNKALKDKNLIFGIRKKDSKMSVSIYEA